MKTSISDESFQDFLTGLPYVLLGKGVLPMEYHREGKAWRIIHGEPSNETTSGVFVEYIESVGDGKYVTYVFELMPCLSSIRESPNVDETEPS